MSVHRFALFTIMLLSVAVAHEGAEAGTHKGMRPEQPAFSVGISDSSIPRYARAACRINAGGSRGSGVVSWEDAQNYYVLTNAHVARTNAWVEFWLAGEMSKPIASYLVWRRLDNTYDLAILRVPKQSLGGFELPVVTLAPANSRLRPYEQIVSVGCANASWQTIFSGHVKQVNQSRVYFVPMPAPGRSGSPLFSADGRYVVGIVGWRSNSGNLDGRTDRDGMGLAMPASLIWSAFGQGAKQVQQGFT